MALAYKLLRYINSSYFYRLKRIDSVAHAITYLGENELRRFIILMLISELASDKPGELVRLAVVRAKMAELLALKTFLKSKADEIFLLGLFSLLDAMLDTTIEYICEQLSLSEPLNKALVSRTGPYAPFLNVVLSYEKRDTPTCLAATQTIGVPAAHLAEIYMQAIAFTQSVLD